MAFAGCTRLKLGIVKGLKVRLHQGEQNVYSGLLALKTLTNECSHTGENIYTNRLVQYGFADAPQMVKPRQTRTTENYQTGMNGTRCRSQRWACQIKLCVHYCSFALM